MDERAFEEQFKARDEFQAQLERAAMVVLKRIGGPLGFADFVWQKMRVEGSLKHLANLVENGLDLIFNPPDEAALAELAFENPVALLELRLIFRKPTRQERGFFRRMFDERLAPEDVAQLQAPFVKAGYRPKPQPADQPEAPWFLGRPRRKPKQQETGDAPVPPVFKRYEPTEEDRQRQIVHEAWSAYYKAEYHRYLERARAQWEHYRTLKPE